jgi:hypothetical protein
MWGWHSADGLFQPIATHIAANGRISFFIIAAKYSDIYAHHIFSIQLSKMGKLVHLQLVYLQ